MRKHRVVLLVLAVTAFASLLATVADARSAVDILHPTAPSLRRCEKDYDEEELAIMIENGEDGYEPDDCALLAHTLTGPERHNFCQLGDEDWVSFRAMPGMIYQLRAESPWNYPTEPHLDLYDGGMILAENDHYFENNAEIWFWNDGPARVLTVRISELRGRADCGNSEYTLSLSSFVDKP